MYSLASPPASSLHLGRLFLGSPLLLNAPISAQFHRIARRRGKHKAILAVAHSVLRLVYYMLRDHQPYSDLGADYFDKLDSARLERHHARRLEMLGYTVTLTPKEAA